MNNKEIDVEREFKRINKLFEKDIFDTRYPQRTLCTVIDEDYFNEWKNRGRNIYINDLFTSLKIRDKSGLKENSINKLLLYIEVIVNLISISIEKVMIERINYYSYDWDTYKLLKENINSLLEDLNYKISKLSNGELVIVEKDILSSSVAETNKKEQLIQIILWTTWNDYHSNYLDYSISCNFE